MRGGALPTRPGLGRYGTFLPKSGRKLPGVGWRWHNGEGRVARGQQCEFLSVPGLDEHCSYPVHGCLQPASAPRSRPTPAEVGAMLDLLDKALAVEHRPDIDIFVGDGHYACKPFKKLLRVVFVLDADEDPAEVRKPTALFATDPEMAPERIYRIHVDRFQIEFNFRDYR